MSGYLNRVTLIGNLGADPEVRTTQGGTRIVSLSLATSEAWTDKNSGERKERTEWHRIVIFNEALGTLVEQYLVKGAKIFIEGKLTTRKWQDNEGKDRYTTEIVLSQYDGQLRFLDSKRSEAGQASTGNNAGARRGASSGRANGEPEWTAPPQGQDPFGDEIPF